MPSNLSLENYGLHDLSNLNFNAIKKSLKNKFITNDKICFELERKISNLTNSKYTVVCNNGTSALMMCILATNIKDVIAIVPNINFVGIASIISLLKGKIIFCDVNQNTGMVDKKSLESIIKKCKKKKIKPNVFIPIHYAGKYLEMSQFKKICKLEKIYLIEDGCHSFGTHLSPKKIVGDCKNSLCTTFSFHPVKNITTIEGGAITTNNKNFYKKILEIRNHSLKKTSIDDPYNLISPSLNFRMGEINAAIGISQLRMINNFKSKRQMLVKYYIEKLSKFKDYFKILNDNSKGTFWHLFVILLNSNKFKERKKLMNFLKKKNIATQIHYKPLSSHKCYKKYTLENENKNSEIFYKSQLTLPLHTRMKKKDIDNLVKAFDKFF